jgi:hypothetical protein
VPALPRAMMAALAGATQPSPPPAAVAPAGDAAYGRVAKAVGAPTSSRPDAPLQTSRLEGSSKATAGGAKYVKLCVSCGQRRRSVLLLPCKHMLQCDACADVDSCPQCSKPCTQRIRVHQS